MGVAPVVLSPGDGVEVVVVGVAVVGRRFEVEMCESIAVVSMIVEAEVAAVRVCEFARRVKSGSCEASCACACEVVGTACVVK